MFQLSFFFHLNIIWLWITILLWLLIKHIELIEVLLHSFCFSVVLYFESLIWVTHLIKNLIFECNLVKLWSLCSFLFGLINFKHWYWWLFNIYLLTSFLNNIRILLINNLLITIKLYRLLWWSSSWRVFQIASRMRNLTLLVSDVWFHCDWAYL